MKYCLHDTISFTRRVGHFWRIFQREGVSPTNQCLCQKTRVIALSCGIKISAVHHLVLTQYTHLTVRQTDGHNYNRNTMHCITCRRTAKNVSQMCFPAVKVDCIDCRLFERTCRTRAVCDNCSRYFEKVWRTFAAVLRG